MRSHHIHGIQFWWRVIALFGAMPFAIGCQLLGTGGSPGLGEPGLGAKPTDGKGDRDYDPDIAFLKLSEIKPVPTLPTPAEPEQIEIPPQGVRSMTGAEELLREGRFTEAMFELEKALRFAPKSFEIHTRLAIVCRQAGNDGRALSHITRAAEIRPDSVVCHYLLGRHRDSEGKLEEAIAEYRLALASGDATKENPFRSLTHFFLGTALEQKGYLSAALDQFELFNQLVGAKKSGEGENEELIELIEGERNNLPQKVAAVYARLGQKGKAADALQAAVDAQPENGELLATHGRLLSSAGRHGDAIRAAKRLVKLDPSVASSIDLLTNIYAAAGRPAGAVQVLQDLRSERPDDAALAMALFDVLVTLERLKEAETVLRDLITQKPKEISIRIKLASFYQSRKQWMEAALAVSDTLRVNEEANDRVVALIRTMSSDPRAVKAVTKAAGPLLAERRDDFALPYLLGLMASEGKDLTRSQQMHQLSLERKGDFMPARIALSEVHLDRHDWESAIRTAKEAMADGLEDPAFLRILGRGYDGLDDMDQAITHFAEAIRFSPRDVESMMALARLYERSNKRNKAQLQYQNLLAAFPGHAEAREALIRLHLTGRPASIEAAGRLLADFEKVGSGTPAYARSVQLIRYWQKRAARGRGGAQDKSSLIREYTESLIKIAEQFKDDSASLHAVAFNLFSERRYDEAGQWCEKLLAVDPTHLEGRELLVYIHWRLMNYDDAEKQLVDMLAERPNRASWRRALGNQYLIVQQFDRAADVYEALATSQGKDAADSEDHIRWLDALQLAGRVDEAFKLVDGWLEKSPQKQQFRLSKLLLLYWSGKSEGAASLCTSWHEQDQGNMQTRRQLIQALLLAEKPAAARRYILEWLDKDPDNNTLHMMLLEALVGENKFGEAVELASSGAAIETVRLDYLDQLAEIHLAARAYDDLVRVRQQIARERKSDNSGLKHLDAWQVGQALILAGRFNVAAQDFTRRIEEADSDPFKIEWLRLLSHCYLKNKRPRLAEKQLQDVLDLQPTQEGINNDLGYTLADNGVDLERAEKHIRLAVGERPTEAAYLDSLGWVLYKQGDFEGAKQWLTKAVRGRSIIQAVRSRNFALARLVQSLDDPVLYDHLGDALWRAGDHAQAVDAWTKAISSFERAIRLHSGRNDFEVLDTLRKKLEAVKENKEPPVAELGEKAAT